LVGQGSLGLGSNYSCLPETLPRCFSSRHSKESAYFCRDFFDPDISHKYIMGLNVYAQNLLHKIDCIDGLVDENLSASTLYDLPVLGLDQLPSDALVLVVSGGRPLTAARKLQSLGIRYLDYFSFYREMSLDLDLIDIVFNEQFSNLYDLHYSRFQKVYSLLDDDESRLQFLKLVAFRYALDVDYLDGFSDRFDSQYFEPFVLSRSDNKSFVDVGCFDGITSLRFAELCPDYRAIYAFEPDPENFAICLSSLGHLRDVVTLPYALSDVAGRFAFCSDGSRSSFGGPTEGLNVSTERLDAFQIDSPGLIKFDIEGGELKALEGARSIIQAHTPCLAVAAYHSSLSFVEIPELVLSICANYQVFLRHYGECIYETVLYFVPKG
tara:strand:- start:672 stop:1814 length:1143 start_codon:yes stop_codon:yes gene_type:complete